MISIIVPFYNRKDFFKEALKSIINQNYGEWECIMVDDGSTDGSDIIARGYEKKDNRFKYIKRTIQPKGANCCRNIGIDNANGDYVMFLDSDDLLTPDCIENRLKQVNTYFDHDFYVFNTVSFDEKKNFVLWNIDTAEDDLTRFLRLDGVWHISSPLYNKKFLKNSRKDVFLIYMPFLQDWELAVYLLSLPTKPKYIKFLNDKPSVLIRRHSNESISQKGWITNFKLLRKFFIFRNIFIHIQKNKGFKIARHISFPMIEIVKEFLILKKFLLALSLLKLMYNLKLINLFDCIYILFVYPLFLARFKWKGFKLIHNFLFSLVKPFLSRSAFFQSFDILKHKLNFEFYK